MTKRPGPKRPTRCELVRIGELFVASLLLVSLVPACAPIRRAESSHEILVRALTTWERAQPPIPADTEQRKLFRTRSEVLSRFWGRDMYLEAAVVEPPDFDVAERLPVCYFIHGFGNWRIWAFRFSEDLLAELNDPSGDYPRMIYVYPNAQFGLGHHAFADSANNGPWGEAFVEDLVPAVEKAYGAWNDASGRFLAGHSSGAWSVLWLQVTYPDAFAGAWAGAPDPVDFRAFTGVDIYNSDYAYVDAHGEEVMLVRQGHDWLQSFRDLTHSEAKKGPFAGQMASFDNVFSPRGQDGFPMRMYDWESGAIDRAVTDAWKNYDLSHILRTQWPELGPKLRGKLHVYVGTLDTFRLNEAVELLKQELDTLGSDADIVLAQDADHRIFQPIPDLWPNGLLERIHREMETAFTEAQHREAVASP